MQLNPIIVPFALGGPHIGVADGATALGAMLQGASTVLELPHVPQMVSGWKNAPAVATMASGLRSAVASALRDNRMPLVCGGDHSVTLGSLAGSLDVYAEGLFTVYIDAHGDFNTPQSSPSGNVHGMHLGFLMGFAGCEPFDTLQLPRLKPSQIAFYATRALDAGEVELAAEHGLRITPAAEIHSRGIVDVCAQLSALLAQPHIQAVHLSIDVDAVDPQYAPGTGVPEPGGLERQQMYALIETVMESGKTVAVDVVEYNPHLDIDNRTRQVCLQILRCLTPGVRDNT